MSDLIPQEGMQAVEQAVRGSAFKILRTGEIADPALIAKREGLSLGDVQGALRSLASSGQVELDPAGRVVGSAGLTLLPTPHRLTLGGVPLHTWCAIDAIGIPAALGQDALATTSCPPCGRELRIEFERGRRASEPGFVAWLPTDPCSNVREELCPQANLFCDEEHLRSWRAGSGDPRGEVLSLSQVEAVGREWWGSLG
ncbi:MAG: alkylmercury lyase family protein [Actinobacteria bacterium]|nr:alkylmercury lyase family protein [Actinomycetota bacterium]